MEDSLLISPELLQRKTNSRFNIRFCSRIADGASDGQTALKILNGLPELAHRAICFSESGQRISFAAAIANRNAYLKGSLIVVDGTGMLAKR